MTKSQSSAQISLCCLEAIGVALEQGRQRLRGAALDQRRGRLALQLVVLLRLFVQRIDLAQPRGGVGLARVDLLRGGGGEREPCRKSRRRQILSTHVALHRRAMCDAAGGGPSAQLQPIGRKQRRSSAARARRAAARTARRAAAPSRPRDRRRCPRNEDIAVDLAGGTARLDGAVLAAASRPRAS